MKTSKEKSRARSVVEEYQRLIEAYNLPSIDDAERASIEKELFAIIDNVGELADAFADEIDRLYRMARVNDEEVKRLEGLRRDRLDRAERLQAWLGRTLFKLQKGVKLETARHEYSFTDSVETLILDEKELPAQYWRTPEPRPVPDKVKIKDRILKRFGKAGTKEVVAYLETKRSDKLTKVPGAAVMGKHNLSIR